MAVPLLLIAVLAMVILPLPPWLLDALFTFNIVLAILVLLVAVSARRPLDFSVFPTVLLVATLMRLTLNVASTRVVLLSGHEGAGAAGKVIEAFGEVVIGGNYVVGMVVFVILMIINFVVITKGGERISEVAARFTLDALPGKQMAIDADLNAGAIDQEQARHRRQEVAREADFYGSMDGASKFVRGDAIAGLLILFINLLGGFMIGMFQYQLSAAEAFQRFALLTIGDGLVAQIPSLLLATAAAIIVTRVNDDSDMSSQVGQQLLASPKVVWTGAAVMLILGLVPGMPTLVFLLFAAVLGYVAWRLQQSRATQADPLEQAETLLAREQDTALGWQDLPAVDLLTLELGYRLVNLVNEEQGAPLLGRIRGVRKSLSEQAGFLLPEVRVRDNLQLSPQEYRIKLAGVVMASGSADGERMLAINKGETYGEVDGELTQDPAYGMPAVWIEPGNKAKALNYGYAVVDSASVVATHVSKLMREHLPELLVLDDVSRWQERLQQQAPKLAELLAEAVPPVLLLRVFRYLLKEQVSLADVVTIATALVEGAEITKDPVLLAADVRCALKRVIVRQIMGERGVLSAFTLADTLEQTLLGALGQAQQQNAKTSIDSFPVEPNLLSQLQQKMPAVAETLQEQGVPAVLLVMPQLRPLLARYGAVFAKGLKVLSYNEVPEHIQIDVVGTLG
ncbi:lateral flagellar biosynthesis protein [Oceanimonas sp. GK1]|uniref:flagellar biosynthesis protein FlhA n=1 Tax=Oceanimonas sp. (strain GK1 / IBRC-M 10197) TaxID=511062 RepID=UPI0002494E69|nr:lateral flagellar biosynthesis protein [Oceanimonas sp. GK1]